MLEFFGMQLYSWNDIAAERMSPTISRKVIHSGRITLARISLAKGAVVPRHSHENEQITNMEKGRLLFRFDDREIIVEAGQTLAILPNEPHSAEALEDCVALDLFAPVREDWLRGDDAYLRG